MNARLLQLLLFAGLILGVLFVSASASGTQIPHEPLFPKSGDPRYDANHYDAHLTYMPATGLLRATDTIEATPLEPPTGL